MWTPPDGGQAVPESLTQLLLSFSSFPTQETEIWTTHQHEQYEVGDTDSGGGTSVEAEYQRRPQFTTGAGDEQEEAVDTVFDAENRINGDVGNGSLFPDAQTQRQSDGEQEEFEWPTPTPDDEGETGSVATKVSVHLFPRGMEANTTNPIHSQMSDQEQCTWKRRIRLGKIPDQREPKRGRVCALEKAMRSYVDRKCILRKDDQHLEVRERKLYVEEFCSCWSINAHVREALPETAV
ncbi:hypothetical protein ZWY2020_012096 [Hordeum vulgare]|nr:hypothetical protein ZWY2020_012096 [Hordeum vulgare]